MDQPEAATNDTSPPTIRAALLVLHGILVASVSWWLIDDLATERLQALNIGVSALVPLIGIALVAAIATVALLLSPIALISAAASTILGLVLGGSGSLSPLVTLPSDDLQFTLLRGAHEPAIWVLAALWLTLGVARLRTNLKRAN